MILKKMFCILVSGILALASCDEVDEQDRLIYVPPVDVQRSIVIEDFTGQRCVNCPAATSEIERLQEQYGKESIIPISIHSGPFGHRTTMASQRLSLCTELGDSYFQRWGVEAQPGVLINRNGEIIYNTAQYEETVRKELAKPTPLKLNVETFIGTGERAVLNVAVEALSSENIDGKLQVWLIEDHIIDLQLMPDGSTNREYEHNHVLRASMTKDIFGDSFPVSDKQESLASFSLEIDQAWNKANLSVVVFYVTDKECVNATIKKIK